MNYLLPRGLPSFLLNLRSKMYHIIFINMQLSLDDFFFLGFSEIIACDFRSKAASFRPVFFLLGPFHGSRKKLLTDYSYITSQAGDTCFATVQTGPKLILGTFNLLFLVKIPQSCNSPSTIQTSQIENFISQERLEYCLGDCKTIVIFSPLRLQI